MKKIRIALGSNDGESICRSHMGMAKDFYVYDLFADGNFSFVEKRDNTSPEVEEEHGDVAKMKAAMEIFNDVDVIIGRRSSPNFVRMAASTRFQPVVIMIDRISEIMKELVRCFEEIDGLVEQRAKGNRPQQIPKLGKKE
jgi:predicted Fe-Mo cluster-binding NifX family protein